MVSLHYLEEQVKLGGVNTFSENPPNRDFERNRELFPSKDFLKKMSCDHNGYKQ